MLRLNRKGFTLVEIMIVVAIIALLAAIAIPNVLRARLNANENATVANLKTICSALNDFASHNVVGGVQLYPAGLTNLTSTVIPAAEPPYLELSWDDAGGNPTKSGYTYSYNAFNFDGDAGGTTERFWIDATPTAYQTSGVRSLHITEQGVVRGFDNAGAAAGGYAAAAAWPEVE